MKPAQMVITSLLFSSVLAFFGGWSSSSDGSAGNLFLPLGTLGLAFVVSCLPHLAVAWTQCPRGARSVFWRRAGRVTAMHFVAGCCFGVAAILFLGPEAQGFLLVGGVLSVVIGVGLLVLACEVALQSPSVARAALHNARSFLRRHQKS